MKKVAIIGALFMLVTACGQEEENGNESATDEQNFGPIEVEVLMDEEGDPGDWELQALVTQGDDPVNDADEVTFEVWRQGQKEDSDMLDYEDVTDGVYTASYTFEDEDVYYVVPHVTARDMHVMPTHQIIIGDAEVKEEEEEHDHDHDDEHDHSDGDGEHDHGDHDHSHHHSDALEITSNFDELSHGDAIELTIMEDHEPLEDARVRLEMWKHGDEAREWVEMEEAGDGVYRVTFEFEETGDYHVVVHIENDELHEHIDDTFVIE
ncbi:FixH family protein [Alteribacter aurantiacus]|uniref:FixH family protein n=1 Tax=Alteribacter aurantiacus TaxID=254410 RepID=UPI00040D57C1|nr:FixH family protein [Alteribacter aurantiacus]